jgi:YajG family uncharacterized lipoprotein
MRAHAAARFLATMATLSVLGGCATSLDVGYLEEGANRSLLASAAPLRIVVGPVTDRRMDKTRIGGKPKNGEAITTTRPVADIVRDALAVELTKNGHVVVRGEGDLRLVADVEDFWLDTAGRNSTTQYVGRVALALAAMDVRSGETLLVRRYVGIRRYTGEAKATEVWRDVMDVALARAMHDIATDPELSGLLARRPAADP